MKKKLTSLILAGLILAGTLGVMKVAVSDDPPLLGMNTEVSTLSVTSDDPPLLG